MPPNKPAPSLTRETIVSTALALLDEVGLDAFSMRRLAANLGVSAQALYWHFDSKEDLFRSVAEYVRDGLVVEHPDPDRGVREQLGAHMAAMRHHWREHPSALEIGTAYVPSVGDEVAAAGAALLRLAGVSGPRVIELYRAMLWTVIGFVRTESAVARSVHHRAVGDSGVVYEVRVPHGAADVLDVDRLFETVVGLFLDGVVASAAG